VVRNCLSAILPLVVIAMLGGCASPSPVAFRVLDPDGRPVVGAHARVILLDAGAPLPVSAGSLQEAAMLTSAGGGFTDRDGRIELPVVGTREHLIEVEGPVLGAVDPANAPVAIWVYRPADGSLLPHGKAGQPLRVERVN
jgi:hypothetical protein